MPKLQRAIAFVALVFVLVAATACGGKSGDLASKNPKAALAAASRRTAEPGTVKMAFSARLGGNTGMSVAKGDGAYDFKKEQGRFKLSVALGSTVELIITADKLYLKQPQALPTGETWVSATQEELAQNPSTAGFLGQLRGQIDPRAQLRNLGANVTGVKKAGKAKIRGTDTTHVSGTVDLSEAAIAKAPSEEQDSLRQARQSLGTEGYPIDVWLDKDGRVRRLEYQIRVGTGAARSAATTVRLDLFDFGEDAGVVLPDPADVKEGLD
jgi:hypothetical protein